MEREERLVPLGFVTKLRAQLGNCPLLSLRDALSHSIKRRLIINHLQLIHVLVLVQVGHGLGIPISIGISTEDPGMKRIPFAQELSVRPRILPIKDRGSPLKASRNVSPPGRYEGQRNPHLGSDGNQAVDK